MQGSEDSWAAAMKEAESPEDRDPALWAKCFAESEGDEQRAKAAYMRAKVAGGTPPSATAAAEEPPAAKPRKKRLLPWWGWVLLAPVIAIGGLMLIGALMPDNPERDARWRAQDAIKLCWSEQGRKSLDASTAWFVAGACEKMERDYEARWGRKP
ncbi:hypothetical protein [Acidovorax sp. Root219]|uniref:hypothetical protein n=1 Tax=Acidovorax sp. Root219 TaxID=1736493 RepID=UPI0007105100|nr:hypothetical protein [Acidovorax sp. Root219]KRC22660.1 hypothetical protein ASE28_25755 [Acidovorax sp. Root219]